MGHRRASEFRDVQTRQLARSLNPNVVTLSPDLTKPYCVTHGNIFMTGPASA
jgi:hypothetical protein